MGLLEPPRYGEQFHQLFMAKFEDRRNTPTKGVKMRKKKTDKKVKENMPAEAPLTPSSALVEFEANASKFAVFSAIRSVILEAEAKYFFTKESDKKSIGQACCPYCSSNCRIGEGTAPECRCHQYPMKVPADGDSDVESEFEESTEKEVTQKVPQIVGAGLKSLFELIAEARNVHPTLCTKALKALFDVIQGQFPESFKSEPSDIVDPLYELLLELATTREEKDIESWSALGCAALLGLCVARADTGKTLRAVTALLMSPKNLPDQLIQLPMVLCSLQRSIHSVTLGKPTKPNFFRNGIPKNSLIDQILLDDQFPSSIQYNSQPSIASDGKYVYILSSRNLVKIGTGFGGTFKGYIYAVNNDFIRENSSGWIGFCNNILLYKRMSKRSNENVLVVNTETLNITGSMHINFPQSKDGVGYILFSDGVALNAICTTKDDSMIVKQLYSSSDSNSFDLPLKLARKNFRTLGYSNFEEELLNQIQIQSVSHHQAHVNYNHFEPKVPTEQEVLGIVCGKEFGLVRTNSKKVYYYGKSNALGLKSVGKSPTMKMTELIVSKVPNIIQVTIGHDGVHAILLGDDGTAYFAGTARRGEDGDTSKNRRLPKASKPKKLNKVEGHFVVQVSCNNGTSAFVTKTGKLIMFGKDTTQCDSSGFVTDLLDQHITKVALGKAHCVALNSKGQLFSFGLNNKGQCGRVKEKDHTSAVMDVSESVAREPGQKLDSSAMCDYEEHNVVQGQCKVCSICRECSGYNISCVSIQSTPWSDRVPGANCSCGHGDAGCSKCGACSSCIMLQDGDDAKNSGANLNFLVRQRSKSLIMRKRDKKIEEGNQGSDAERDPPRVAPLSPQRLILPSSSPVVQIACGLHHTVVLTLAGEVYTFGSNQYGQLGTGDLQPVVGPAQIDVTGMVSQIAAGSNHTVLLTYEGVVYTFGNYQKGQLGRIPSDIQQQTVVSQKEDLNKSQGSGESSRISQKLLMQRQSFLWNCTPESVTGMGPSVGKKATWIGASGDQTFIKVDESLITGAMLSKINVVADKNTILLIPHVPLTFQCLAINRRDGSCNAHTSNQVDFAKIIEANHNAVAQFVSDKCNQNIEPQSAEPAGMSQSIYEARNQLFDLQEQKQQEAKKRKKPDRGSLEKMLPQLAFALDMGYGCLWIFDAVAKKLMCYNVIASEIQNHSEIVNFKAILSSELALPLKSEVEVTRNHASLNLLASLDILTSGHDVIPNCFERMPAQQNVPAKDAQNTEFQSVTRFENFGGGWGYSGHSVECVRFMVDSDIILCGFGMYGGRGEYTCKIKLFDLGIDGGGYEKEGILLTETEEVPFECPARSIHNIILPKSIQAAAGRWYLVWARVSGPSSDCGSSGQPTVTTEDQIVFTFKTSKKANNGTDVNSGQIPSILYRIITQETNQPTTSLDADPVHRITRMFANSVTKECFESLVTLLKWSWATFKMTLNELTDKKNQYHTLTILNRLIYINKVCLRLLRKYIGEIYPNKFIERPEKSWKKHENEGKNSTHMYVVNQGPSTSKNVLNNRIFNGSMEATTPTNNRKYAAESNQLAECIGEIRALLIQILCDDLPKDASDDGLKMITLILDECHITFVACFNSFYPTPSLKWNYLCDLFMQMEKGVLHSRLLSAILAGLCSPTVQLKSTFSLLTPSRENKSIVSPSDNSGLPMLTSSDYHQYPVLVEQMIYRTQQEKINFTNNTWTFKNILTCLLGIISYPIKSKMEMNYSRDAIFNQKIHQGLIDNCCHLLARVLAEIVYQSCVTEFDPSTLPSKSRHCTSNRFGRTDVSRTWNTGNFGPDAIAFTVDRSGIAIAGAMVYSGSGNYEYQLELLYDTMETNSQHKWEAIESVSGLYDQSNVQNEMAELKFERPVHIKENVRYAIRLCSQGARTCSGDAGLASIRGPCGTFFTFYPCDLSFNGTTPTRGQIPSLLYYSTPMKNEGHASKVLNEMHARETALQIATDITRKASEMLILARNTLAASISSSDKSPNSSNNTQTVDSEHNITPIEEHIDVAWTNNSNNPANSLSESNLSRDFTKRIESFSKGLMETLKFDKRNTNPYDFGEIEIGATEIHPNDLLKENEIQENKNFRNGKMSKINGNNRVNYDKNNLNESDTDEDISQGSLIQILEVFGLKSASMFHSLLPLVYAHIGPLANSDPKSSVRILSLIKEILPHVTALNQLYSTQDTSVAQRYEKMKPNMYQSKESTDLQKKDDVVQSSANQCTTSHHYCIVESDHPYKNATISTYRVTFPACVQWFTIEFDPQCGTAQQEDCLHVSIPARMHFNDFACNVNTATMDESREESWSSRDKFKMGKSTEITASFISTKDDNAEAMKKAQDNEEWLVIKKFSTPNQWCQKSIILPGNKVEFSLETASPYARDQQSNRYGFKCHVVGYDNPSHTKIKNSCLIRLEHELAHLGGMCTSNLMKKDLMLPDDTPTKDITGLEETLAIHSPLLTKGLALPDSALTINQALDAYLPIGAQSNERQFLKDFVTGAPGSSGARLAAWLQPEPRLDTNKCELKPIQEPIRYGWPTQLIVLTRDQYGDNVFVPDLKIEIRASPAGIISHGNKRNSKISQTEGGIPMSGGGASASSGGGNINFPPPPNVCYEATFKDKMCLKAITCMKAFERYSFEELRYSNATQTRISEILQATDLGDGTFGVLWTPNTVGGFCLTVSIDGITLEEIYRVEVKEAGIPPPPQKSSIKKSQPPNKLRKFMAKYSAGLRIRSHPTLQSEQVGIIKMNGIISFIDEIENDDGVWVRLSTESIRQHCTSGWYPTEAWCLQYNQHLGKTLLHPVVETHTPKPVINRIQHNSNSNSNSNNSTPDINEMAEQPEVLPKHGSPKKGFDFTTTKFTPPLSGESGGSGSSLLSNPFQFASNKQRPDDMEDSESKNVDSSNSTDSIMAKKRLDDDHSQIGSIKDELSRRSNLATSSQTSSNQANIGSALAGVVGGGAIKHDLHSTMSSSSRSVEISDTSAFVSSLTRDLSQSPSQGSIREDPPNESSPKQSLLSDTHTSQTEKNPTAIRTSNFSLGTVLTSSSLSSPKHSPRKMRTKRAISPGLSHFGHPKEKEKTEHTSPSFDFSSLNMQEDAKSSSSGGSVDKSAPPVWPQTVFTSDVKSGPPKRALPPSLAESLRAVFAAFLWHEGLVHDAMACASFLKFYPSLPKQGALVVTRGDIGETKISMSKEQKAQQRYSVEVAYSGSDLNIRPSTLETLTKSGNSSLYRRYRKMNADGTSNSDKKPKLQSLPEVVTVMPPALRCLVFLWEQLCSNCVQFVQTSTVEVPKESPTIQSKDNAKEKCSNSENAEKDVRKGRKKKKDDGSWCELCEIYLPIPVTYHMRIIHPGCGKPAKGKGYNSVGTFCEGWAGNCGEGGKGASSWYLMCDTCREKFRSGTKNINQTDNSEYQQCIPNVKFESIFGLKSSMVINSEVYAMMKENAMFLLELAPTGSGSVNTNQKKSPQQLPLVVENHVVNPPDFNRPGTSRGAETSGGGSGGGGSNRNSRISLKSYSGIPTTSQYRKSSVLPLCISPELIWQAPEMFSCLESLGATMINELPYEIFGLSSVDNGFDRPLSDISFDSVDPERHFTTSMTHSSGGAASRFPRSYSMGQGWNANYEGYSRLNASKIEDQSAKVVYRRRNNSPCDGDAGSLLLCYPSEHLRKLVPDSVFNSSCMQPQQAGEYHVKQQKTDFKLNERNDFKSTFTAPIDPSKVDEFQFGDLSFGASRETNENSGQNLNSQDGVKEEKRFDLDENTVSFLMRPVMSFILQRHNLDKLKHYMKRNLRVAICRIYSLQALNWLTRSVTQPVCLHDLMWWFVTSLTVSSTDGNEDGESALEHPVASTQMSGKISMVLSQSLHTFLQTVADLTLLLPAGSALQQIAIQCFGIRFKQADHQFLHRSHVFGNISKILSKSDEQNEDMLVSSAAAGQMQESNINFSFYHCGQAYNSNGASIQNLIDLGGMFELTVSSRQAMAASLTDNSTETFWESDEEDRNKSKIIEISMTKANHTCKILFVHIDNSRDIQNKVSNLMFYAGQSLGDTNLIKSLDIDTKTGSWFSAYVPDETCTHFRLEMRGPENSLRVRQVKVLGISTGPDNFPAANKLNLKSTNSVQIQQRNCETETLRVFRLITAQVFGKLILGPSNVDNIQMSYHSAGMMESSTTSLLADSLDLREHMVGILFSRSKLSHLQKQVIVHIVQAIRKEAQRAKEEWEIQNNGKNLVTQDQRSDSSSDQSRSPDTYCFEMLSMVLALSGSAVGRSYLSHQHGLLKDLLSLLHTGSDRVQRQVTALLRRILPEISPESLGDLLCVQKMPPEDFSIAHQSNGTFDMCMLGIIDIFLAIIAKSLQLQVKVKTTSGPTKNPPTLKLANCIDLNIYNLKKQPLNDNDVDQLFDFKCKNLDKESPKNLNQRWFLKGSISNKQAENIICLIRDMASGKLSDKWSLITKAAVAESILNLTRLDEIFRNPDNCIKTATLWLALASLCVLDRDHVEKLSSGQWSKTSESRPLCTNHDDGITSAVIQCNACGSLCGDCDRFLHLNRKTRNHHRTVCKEEEEAIRVELHESCGRTKLFWLLALADSKTLKGIVEFRDGSSAIVSIPANSVGRCRFCGVTGNSGLLAIGNVCADAQCQEHAANTCAKIKQCGHACGGVAHETKCLPCLQNVCHDRENQCGESFAEPKLTQDADDMCMICFVEALSCAPSIQLECGHVFHFHCCKTVLQKRWTGPRISFGFSQCPICKIDIKHLLLGEILEPIITLKTDVKRKAMMRLEYEGVIKATDHKDLASYAMDRYAYYVCFKCQKAYYGGEARCDAEIGDNYNPQELVCGGCSDVARAQMCPKHGTDFLEYKCRYCCSVAVFFCFGTTHFCDTCHDDFQRLTNIPKNKLPRCPAGPKAKQLLSEDCPLHIVHPQTGEEFALGCGICRNAQTF